MQVLGIATGEGIDPNAVVDPLVERLDAEGSVGVVRAVPPDERTTDGGNAAAAEPSPPVADGSEPTRTEYTVDGSTWSGRGADLDVRGALDRLAPAHEYALLVNAPDARVPHLTVGKATAATVVLSAPDAESVDVEAAVEAIEAAEPYETLESLVAAVKRSPKAEYAGAIATFTGRVRAKDDETDPVTTSLEFERYDAVAEDRMGALEAELTDREGVQAVRLHHRTGRIEYGEDIVFVVVLAGHRDVAFDTVEDGIDRLKAEVPIFKKEVTVEEEFWVHERS